MAPVEALSNLPPRCQAPMMPIQTPKTIASTVEVPTSSSVGQSRSSISWLTGTP